MSHAPTERPGELPGNPPVRPRVWTVFAAVLLALTLATGLQALLALVMVGYYLIAGLQPAQLSARIAQDLARPMFFLFMLCLGQLGFGLAAWYGVWKSPAPWRQRIGWAVPLPAKSIYVLATLGAIIPTAIGLGAAEILAPFLSADPSFAALFDNLTVSSAAAFVILIGVLPGFCEEIMFRGYMQQRLIQRWGAVAGVIVTSLVFALVHVMPLNIIAVLPIGLWFGYVAYRSGSILPAILCHFFVNSGVNLCRMIVRFSDIPNSVQQGVPIVAILIGSVCFVVCLRPSYWTASQQSPLHRVPLS